MIIPSEMTSPNIKIKSSPFHNESMINQLEMFNNRLLKTEKKAPINVSSIIDVECSASLNLPNLRFKTETVPLELDIKTKKLDKLVKESLYILDEIISKKKLTKVVNKKKIFLSILKVLNNFSNDEINISKEELYKRIEKIAMISIAFGTLKELNSKDLNDFDEIVKKRNLFK
jgi:hypothetical protein